MKKENPNTNKRNMRFVVKEERLTLLKFKTGVGEINLKNMRTTQSRFEITQQNHLK